MFLGIKILFDLKVQNPLKEAINCPAISLIQQVVESGHFHPHSSTFKTRLCTVHTCGSASQSCSVWEMRKGLVFAAVL